MIALTLVPFGDVRGASLGGVASRLHEAYGVDVRVAGASPLPTAALDPRRQQWRTRPFLDALVPHARRGLALGVADVDLYTPDLNFVFGEADPARDVAVFSLARPHGPEPTFGRRCATEAVHEVGHVLGLRHCARPDCVMWFSDTLAETDRKGWRFCPAHAEAVRRVVGAGVG